MKFGILCAMDEEIKTLIDNLDSKKKKLTLKVLFSMKVIFSVNR